MGKRQRRRVSGHHLKEHCCGKAKSELTTGAGCLKVTTPCTGFVFKKQSDKHIKPPPLFFTQLAACMEKIITKYTHLIVLEAVCTQSGKLSVKWQLSESYFSQALFLQLQTTLLGPGS